MTRPSLLADRFTPGCQRPRTTPENPAKLPQGGPGRARGVGVAGATEPGRAVSEGGTRAWNPRDARVVAPAPLWLATPVANREDDLLKVRTVAARRAAEVTSGPCLRPKVRALIRWSGEGPVGKSRRASGRQASRHRWERCGGSRSRRRRRYWRLGWNALESIVTHMRVSPGLIA